MIADYLVVGAGAAGCALAGRLAAEPGVSVLLVEHGGPARNPLIAVPRAFYVTLRSKTYTHRYPTRAVAGGDAEVWMRGRGVGGSTLVNGMMWVRGSRADADALAAAGNPGWDARAFADAYASLERRLGVSVPTEGDDVTEALFSSAASLGLRRTDDVNAADDERIGFTPATIRDGRRVTAAALLRPSGRQGSLTVLTRARVDRVLLDGTRAVGVLVERRGRMIEVRARREVLVAAGAVESPLLLERSGIGRPDVLTAAGVTPVVESSNVGERMIEQRAVSMQVRFRDRRGPTERLNTRPKQLVEGARYLATRRGPVATSGYDVVSVFRSSPAVDRPDVQGVWVPMALDETSARMQLAPYSGMLFTGYAVRPTTPSSVHLGADAVPVVAPRYLEHEAERAATGSILEHARRVVATGPLADLVADEVFPGPTVATPEDVVGYALRSGGGIYHAVGSCAMGPADDDVVDHRLRVRGTDGLRVVDASVLPRQLSGSSAAPVTAVGWIAGGMVLGDS
ncbi:GMC family oxidoreductase [Aeromicrobium chenweiae]|uniref:GMC oxidoreductase n=1 Tax=Aeromicrobium chenweiae TaxID=2079793 RepID=A0A2S0WQF7_9ACTN|nr:GMC family oxidoreductase N-terminal domain-containing protein [Aeromicrobium chenweiae]AWB93488.1 GMC oxidoreductase [Aeromicrobium chenweiae]TGN34481.1 FAD-binding protein [Aeromicrobium chenweiae]